MDIKRLLYLACIFLPALLNAQKDGIMEFEGKAGKQVVFLRHPAQKFGFDDFHLKSWDEQPAVISGKNDFRYIVPVKSVSQTQPDVVYVHLKGGFDSTDLLIFTIAGDTGQLHFTRINDTLAELEVPAKSLNYEIIAQSRKIRQGKLETKVYGKLKVVVYPEIRYSVTVVPLVNDPIGKDSLQAELNALFRGANLKLELTVAPRFQAAGFNDSTILEDPDTVSLREYTDQMFALANAYELTNKSNAYKLFVVRGFEDSLTHGYMGLGNRTGFVTAGTEREIARSMAFQLGRGIGFIPEYKLQVPKPGDSVPEMNLSFWDWEQMRSGEAGHTTWVESNKVKRMGAVAAYYFWEENADGSIDDKSIHSPYKRNYLVSVTSKMQKAILPSEQVEFAVSNLMNDNAVSQKSTFEIKTASGVTEKFHLPLKKEETSGFSSVIFKKVNGTWESETRKNVLYFNVVNDSARRFSHASDSLILSKYNVKMPAVGHYIVKTFWKNNGKISRQEVYAYNGENVTKFFLQPEKIIPRRVLVFSNGYRGRARNKDVSDNLVTSTDRYTYWLGIDKAFVKRLEPFETFYIDGNHDISTSGHRNMLNFGLSLAVVKTFATKDYYKILNSRPNEAGFNERREKGRIAGNAFLIARCNSPACMETVDTVDIVCHSMGYSYALGFIDAIKGKVVFGKMYIIAPENACVGGTDWSMFEEVWQYGSNLDQPDPDPVWEQDGIAPQCQVKGLETVPPGKGGRAFFPKDWPKKNFVDSHMLYSYFWMFECIKEGENGYIHK